MKIAYIDRTGGACDYYRAVLPLKTAGFYGAAQVLPLSRGEILGKIEQLYECDVVVCPRPGEPEFEAVLAGLRKAGKKIVVDFDDNVFDVSPLSAHYADHGTRNVKYRFADGREIDLWVDPATAKEMPVGARPLPIERNRRNLECVARFLGEADLVTTTTELLAEVFREYNKNVAVLPNCVDPRLWQKLPLVDDGKIRLTWFGGHSHYEDWTLLQGVLPPLFEKYPNLVLVLMGVHFAGTTKGIPQDRIEFHRWVPTPAYPYKAAILNPTIALIPLQDTRFNACKSAIKWIEMGALRVPSVTSYVSPYKEIATEENGIFVEHNDPAAWSAGIEYLIQHPEARQQMGEAAHKTVREKFDVNKQYPRWVEAYQKLGVTMEVV